MINFLHSPSNLLLMMALVYVVAVGLLVLVLPRWLAGRDDSLPGPVQHVGDNIEPLHH